MGKYNTRLFSRIRDRGLKNKDVAEMAGIQSARFSRILTGIFKPRDYERREIAKVLRTSQKKLFFLGRY